MEYDVDLSRTDCGCVAALYVIGMPGIGSDGQPFESTDGLHYCDAQAVGGNFCPEFDIMEANQWAYHATSHSCDTPDANGHYTNCDRPGTCDLDIYDHQPDVNFGPGAQYQINTLQEFHTKVEFKQDTDGEFSEYSIILTQDGREVTMTTNNCKEGLSKMTQDFTNGMVFAMSSWSPNYGDLTWMQHDRCTTPCSQQGLSFKNLQFNTAATSTNGDNDSTDNTDNSDTTDNTDTTDNGGSSDNTTPITVSDIVAGFAAIHNNPHYSDTEFSRTLYQVD